MSKYFLLDKPYETNESFKTFLAQKFITAVWYISAKVINKIFSKEAEVHS